MDIEYGKTIDYYFKNTVIGMFSNFTQQDDNTKYYLDNGYALLHSHIEFNYRGIAINIKPCDYDKYIVLNIQLMQYINISVQPILSSENKWFINNGVLIDTYDGIVSEVLPVICKSIKAKAVNSETLNYLEIRHKCEISSNAFNTPNLKCLKILSDDVKVDYYAFSNYSTDLILDISEINHVLFVYRNLFPNRKSGGKFKPTLLVRKGSGQFISLIKDIFGNNIKIIESEVE